MELYSNFMNLVYWWEELNIYYDWTKLLKTAIKCKTQSLFHDNKIIDNLRLKLVL